MPFDPESDRPPIQLKPVQGQVLAVDPQHEEGNLRFRLQLAVGALVGAAFTGLGIAIAFQDNDAAREIGGALVSGAIVGLAVITFEEVAESRRQLRQDRRDSQRDIEAEEREHAQVIRADELAIWSQLNSLCYRRLAPALRGVAVRVQGGPEGDDRLPRVDLQRAENSLDGIAVSIRDELLPLASQVVEVELLIRLTEASEYHEILYENSESDDFVVPRGQDDLFQRVKRREVLLRDLTDDVAAEYRHARTTPLRNPSGLGTQL